MKMTMLKVAVVMLAALPAVSMADSTVNTRGVAAIQKVIQMMNDMQAKAKKEKGEEEIAFSKYSTWCKMEKTKFGKSIAKAGASIERLGTSIDKLNDEAKKLGEGVAKLQGEIAGHEANMKGKKNARAAEHATYEAEAKDFAESVSALERAIEVMSKQDYDRSASSAALLQVSSSSKMPEKTKDVIAAFLGYDATAGMDDEGDDYAAPEANGYEFQSAGIVGVLKNLLDKFRTEKATCDKEEANAKHAHDMVMVDLADTVSSASKDSGAKTSTKSKHEQKSALDKKQKKSTEGVKAEDESTLKDVETACSEKTASFDDKQQLRADEIEAIGKAIAIMSSGDVSSFIESAAVAGKKMLGTYAQLRSQTAEQGIRGKVHEFLTQESKRQNSRALSLLANTLEADPFAKVKGLISDMLNKLRKEANEDAEHNGFCTTEMGKSKNTRTQLTEDIDSLTASIEDAKAEIISLSEENAQLAKDIDGINSAMTEATEMRTAEKARNKATVEDADAAVKAVDAATAVLKDFYEKASQATALVQGGGMQTASKQGGIKMGSDEWEVLGTGNSADPKDKQTFGEAYKGNQDSANGVLAMIEVIRSDFATLSADTKASEESNIKSLEELTTESKKNLAMKNKKTELNDADKAATERKRQEDNKDLKSNSDELIAADRYFAKLQDQCIAKGSSSEDRVKARASEIQSLKEALQMLD